jgi:hypothetical protein
MKRLAAILGMLIFVFTIWTSSPVVAATPSHCVPISESASGHFEGDRDQVPDQSGKGVAHHHSGCGGHQLSASTDVSATMIAVPDEAAHAVRPDFGLVGRSPDRELRPPIA